MTQYVLPEPQPAATRLNASFVIKLVSITSDIKEIGQNLLKVVQISQNSCEDALARQNAKTPEFVCNEIGEFAKVRYLIVLLNHQQI